MKRIGKTDQGGILLEMTTADVVSLIDACKAMSRLFDEVEVFVPAPDPAEVTPPQSALPPAAIRTTKTGKAGLIACQECGKKFEPARKDSKFCSKGCRDKAYRAEKHGNVKPVSVTKCLGCGRPFEPKRKDQSCCSTKCRMTLNRKPKKITPKMTTIKVMRDGRPATQDELKAAVAGKPLPEAPATSKADRLALLKRLANKGVNAPSFVERSGQGPSLDDVPEFQRARSMAGEEG